MENISNWKKNTYKFIASQSISMVGSMLVQYAIVFHITLSTKSAIMMMISTVVSFLPQMLISFFSGVWADRYDRKLIIMLSDGGIAIATLLVALLYQFGYGSIWALFVVSAARSLGQGIHGPASNSLIPSLVPEDQLMKVNGIQQSIQSIFSLAAPAISGFILANASLSSIFYIDVITAAIAIVALVFIKLPRQVRVVEKNKMFYELKEGLKYINSSAFIKGCMIYSATMNFLIVPASTYTALYIAIKFGEEVWRLSVNEMLFGGGMIIGGLIITLWGGFKSRVKTVAMASLILGIANAVLGIVNNFYLFVAFTGVIGIAFPCFNVPAMTMLQENIDPDKMGRVISFFMILSTTIIPLATIIYGPLAQHFGVAPLYIASGVGMLVQAIWVVKSKSFKGYS